MTLSSKTAFERLFDVMTRPWVVLSCFGLIIISVLYIDQPVTIAAHAAQFEAKFPWLALLSKFGKKKAYIIGLVIVALTSRLVFQNRYWERRAWFLLICLFFSNLVCLVLKVTVGRARPDLYFSEHLYGFYGPHKNALYWSFPSGHTTTIMALMFGLSALFPRYMIGFILFGSLVAVSRILLLQHYLSDVLMASYLALIEVGFLYYWLPTFVRDNKKRTL
jgi:membrane-associated phospholipid phosphatase